MTPEENDAKAKKNKTKHGEDEKSKERKKHTTKVQGEQQIIDCE